MADPILMGNRSVQVFDANGKPVDGTQGAAIALQGLQQGAGATAPETAGPSGFKDQLTHAVGGLMDAASTPVRELASGNVNPVDIVNKLKERLGAPGEGAQAVAKRVVPQSPAAAAMLALGGPVTKSLGVMKGAGALAGTGAAINAATGDNPLEGAASGAASALVPAAVSGTVNKGAEIAQKLVTKSGIRDIAEHYADRLLAGMKEDAPALYNAVKGAAGSAPSKLVRALDPETWQNSMGSLMEKAEKPIIKAVPQIPSPTQPPPTQGVWPGATPAQVAKMQALGMPTPGTSVARVQAPVMMKTEEALAQLKQLKADARDAFDPANPAASKSLRDAARDLEQRIFSAVKQADPQLAANWQQAAAQYNQGLRYQELVKAGVSKAEPSASGTPFNPDSVVRHYFTAPGRYAPSRMPGLNRNLFPGETGVSPELSDPSLYARAFLPFGAKFNIPTPKIATVPGKQYGAPELADILGNAARVGVVNLGSGQR